NRFIINASRMSPKTYNTQRHWSHTLKIRRSIDRLRQTRGQLTMFLDTCRQPLLPKITQHHPQFQSGKAMRQREIIIHQIWYIAALTLWVVEIVSREAQGSLAQC